jgi:hypothetical protein
MDLILFLVGVVVAFAGAALIRYAVPVADPIAGALLTSGIVALVGGLILFGLAAAVRSLSRIANGSRSSRCRCRRSRRSTASIRRLAGAPGAGVRCGTGTFSELVAHDCPRD